MENSFKYYKLELLTPSFDSTLLDAVLGLEHLRHLRLSGTTPPPIFFQLKNIFHMLESLGSARIEGNHTTLADYVESKFDGKKNQSDNLKEMENIEKAMRYIEESITPGSSITEQLIRELHGITVLELEREGDKTPGSYRSWQVSISQSDHTPPDAVLIPEYMQELVSFINEEHPQKFDLIKVALAHHRFGWIHPFGNGNGRVVRLLTYALLIKYGFNVTAGGRILNPTAVFCNNRDIYYSKLASADSGEKKGLEEWCTYVLTGILNELRKVDQLTDFKYLHDKILIPAINFAQQRELITAQEMAILKVAAKKGTAKAKELSSAMPKSLTQSQITYQIKKLVDCGMLQPVTKGARRYIFGFNNNYLIRGVISALTEEGFIPEKL